MQDNTKSKMAQIIADQLAKANNIKTFKTAPATKPIVKPQPKPIQTFKPAATKPQQQITAAKPEMSTMTTADLLNEKPTTATAAAEAVAEENKISIVDYSEKAFAVIGDTKPIKDQLGAAGGRFNYNLKCGAGWIFSKKRLAQVQKILNIAA